MTGGGERGKSSYEFGHFRLDAARRLLLKEGAPVPLLPRSFDTLLVLVRSGGDLVDKDTLLSSVWRNEFVEENSLAKAISDIRKTLGEGPKDGRYIVTVPGRGYRFAAAVRAIDTPTQTLSVAVLPLCNLTPHNDDEQLAVGLADAIITRLSRLRTIIVRPTGSVLRYAGRDRDPVVAARDLLVDYVVDGTLRRSAERVRASIQLISAETGATLWADTFDEHFADLFVVEDVIAARVAETLPLPLGRDQRPSLEKHHTRDPEAYQLYLRGRFFWSTRTEAGCRKAIELFDRALARDNRFALAYTGLADTHILLALQATHTGGLAPHATMPHALQALARALKLDPTAAEPHASRGLIETLYQWDWAAAERAFVDALTRNPNYVDARHWYAMALSYMHRWRDATVQIGHALEIEPFSPIANANLGRILYFARRYDEAITHLGTTLEIDPNYAVTHHRLGQAFEGAAMYDRALEHFSVLRRLSNDAPPAIAETAHCYAVSGRQREARELLRNLEERAHHQYVSAASIGQVYIGLGEHERAFDWLDRAVEERALALATIHVSPRYDPLRGNPRFDKLAQSIGSVRDARALPVDRT